MASASPSPDLLRLRVSIAGSDPLIWRQLEVDSGLRLDEFHDVLQLAFGWRNSHLHHFMEEEPWSRAHGLPRIGRQPRVWGMTTIDDLPEDDLPEDEWTLAQVFGDSDDPLFYEYDFGDCWVHVIEVIERIHDPKAPRAALVNASRRAPLDDAGGIGGYEEKLEILANAAHPEHEEIADWIQWVSGPWNPFDPEAVDIEHINREFALRFAPDAATSQPDVGAVPPGSAIAALLERMPLPIAAELRGHLARSGALNVAPLDAETARGIVEPFAWMIRAAGTDGIRLTGAGWLPPAVVHAAMNELGWTEAWYGKANREDITAPIRNLREDATHLGMLRKRNGVLYATSAATKLVDDPVALWRHLAGSVVRKTRLGPYRDVIVLIAVELAAGDLDPRVDGGRGVEGVGFGLEVLGWVSADGTPLTDADVHALVVDALNMMRNAGAFGRPGPRGLVPQVNAAGRAFATEMLRTPVA
ncbi:hypothetical protein GCM10028798_05550 [Humibacter antri]